LLVERDGAVAVTAAAVSSAAVSAAGFLVVEFVGMRLTLGSDER
jgi:hypothetical protein